MAELIKTRLNFWTCYFLDSYRHNLSLPEDVTQQNRSNNNTTGQIQQLYCNGHGAYLSTSEFNGRVVCIVLISISCCIGMLGIFTNTLNILVLRRTSKSDGGFKSSLLLLSAINLLLCASTIGFSLLILLISESIDRGQVTMILFTVFRILQAVTRTMSVYLSILFALERYIAITKPFTFNITYRRKRLFAVCMVIAVCLLMNLPWMAKYKIVKNKYILRDDSSHEILQFPYITELVEFAENIPWIVRQIALAFDYFLPFPLILLFHLLFYTKMQKWKKKRTFMTNHQVTSIRHAKVYAIVVSVILAYYSISCMVYVVTRCEHFIFRELYALQNLGIALGASSDFCISYVAGVEFKREFWKMINSNLGNRLPKMSKKIIQRNLENPVQFTDQTNVEVNSSCCSEQK